MDSAFFEEILREEIHNIQNVEIKKKEYAVKKGKNCLSEMWRFSLGYTPGQDNEEIKCKEKFVSLLAKCEPDAHGPTRDWIKNQDMFKTEQMMYKHVVPEMELLLMEKIAPKCYYHGLIGNSKVLILEDLAPQDPEDLEDLEDLGSFKTADLQEGLSLTDVSKVLEKIADFHAASVRLYEREPEVLKPFNMGFMSHKTPRNLLSVARSTLQMVCNKYQDCPKWSKTCQKLTALKAKLTEEILQVMRYDNEEFCVLNHGDCWTNNIMFRKDGQGEVEQILLVDYQMAVYSSPVIDLIYCLSLCPSIDIKTDNDKDFFTVYLRRLTKTMTILGCKTRPPTITELYEAMHKRRMWVVLCALTIYPRIIANCLETLDDILKSGETKTDIFENPNASDAIEKTFRFLEENGHLD